MKHILLLVNLLLALNANGQELNANRLTSFEQRLDDVMEITESTLVKKKLAEVERAYRVDSSEVNRLRRGLIYHEVAFNLTFLDDTEEYDGYAQRSYDILTGLAEDSATTPELMVFVQPYRASALSLVSAETKKLKLLNEAFAIFAKAIERYADVSPRPEFMRGSVAENLPWFMFRKKRYAAQDFASIIEKQEQDADYADFRIMSFSYWAWANAHQKKKDRKKAIEYLDRAIEIDPHYQAGRQRAEELKAKFTRQP